MEYSLDGSVQHSGRRQSRLSSLNASMKESLQKLSLFSETQGLQTFLRRKKESPRHDDILPEKSKNKRENIYKQLL